MEKYERKVKHNLKCPNCNAELIIDENPQIGICPCCGSKHVIAIEKVQENKGALGTFLDFIDTQIDKHRQSKKEKELRKQDEKIRKEKIAKENASKVLICSTVFIIAIIMFCIVMGYLEKKGVL